jgi:hypothetical protein
MFFYIVGGTKVRENRLGMVADRCPDCDGVRRFAVTEHYAVPHVYYIPLGQGTRQVTIRTCQSCGSQFNCQAASYDAVLEESTADSLALNEVLSQANSQLARTQEACRLLEERGRQHAGAASDGSRLPWALLVDEGAAAPEVRSDDARLPLAVSRLQGCDNLGEEGTNLLERLSRWNSLANRDRKPLLGEVDAFLEQRRNIKQVIQFLR